ncbi:GntR family transcriptional regulator [Clostridium sp. AM58-1XD]|uniref:GntR family transcriptional regulator n=1 Tax=Clostridium sp. AM58-1XD TaxID=2292307 RepID=UPI000E48BBF1|nr:GntR family transcriptional regulator [Clostridium sp. AM58-1XD]RGZ00599.1 GntR family transcriptional regulator [Clostridium sp. AM58-1XD]
MKESKADIAYGKIKEELLSYEGEGQDMLSESYFVQKLNISRTPIRAALQRLQKEKLIRIVPNQGIVIQTPTLQETFQLYEHRMVVERYLVQKSFRISEKEDFSKAEDILNRQRRAVEAGDVINYLNLDPDFHSALHMNYNNQFMEDTLQSFRDRTCFIRYRSACAPFRMKQVVSEHQEILELLKKRNIDGAVELLDRHNTHVIRSMTDQLYI